MTVLILPLIDLLILVGSASAFIGFIIKAIDLTTRYSPSFMGLASLDFVVIAGICFSLSLTLVARSWMKLNEPKLAEAKRMAAAAEARLRAAEMDLSVVKGAETAGADRP